MAPLFACGPLLFLKRAFITRRRPPVRNLKTRSPNIKEQYAEGRPRGVNRAIHHSRAAPGHKTLMKLIGGGADSRDDDAPQRSLRGCVAKTGEETSSDSDGGA